MSLRIHNTLSRALEEFSPLEPGHVRMYVCGITVYDLCHVGHARANIAFDVVQRWLRASGYKVTFVRNITDIEDKIIRRAVENGEAVRALTDRMIAEMYRDFDALGIERPTHDPRATDFVPQMLDIVKLLEGKGLAYSAEGGDVNYAVRRFPGYGKLSGKSLDELHAGERVAVLDGKDDPLDFVLWKAAKPAEPDDAKWDSSYGKGRPGWHIECSAMACALLGKTFDIHGGGADLQFPHHENEIAQSEGAFGVPLARYWMHNGFLNIDNEKMSKSLGNFFTIRDVLQKFDAETLRFFMVRVHYRSAINYSDVHLEDARSALKRLYTALDRVAPVQMDDIDWSQPYAAKFKAAMDNDFATPEAMAVLFDLAAELNRGQSARARRPAQGAGRLPGHSAGRPPGVPARRHSAGRSHHRKPDRTARGRQEGQELRRGRPHSRRTAGPGRGAEGLGHRHHLGGCLLSASSPELVQPEYWGDACRHLARKDRVMKRLIPQFGDACLQSRGDPFTTLARSIVGQQISVKAAQTVWDRFAKLPRRMSAGSVLKLKVDDMQAAGLSARKIEYLVDLALHFDSGAIRVDAWQAMADEEIITELVGIRGIGRWTAEMFLIFHLMRPNVLPLDDVGLLNGISRNYFSGDPVSRSDAREVAAAWAPYCSVATWYIWRSLDPLPVEY